MGGSGISWAICSQRQKFITLTHMHTTAAHIHTTHTHTQPFNGLWSGTTRVGRYQKKHSPTHTHPDHRTSFINFLHLLRSIASSLFSLCAWHTYKLGRFTSAHSNKPITKHPQIHTSLSGSFHAVPHMCLILLRLQHYTDCLLTYWLTCTGTITHSQLSVISGPDNNFHPSIFGDVPFSSFNFHLTTDLFWNFSGLIWLALLPKTESLRTTKHE